MQYFDVTLSRLLTYCCDLEFENLVWALSQKALGTGRLNLVGIFIEGV